MRSQARSAGLAAERFSGEQRRLIVTTSPQPLAVERHRHQPIVLIHQIVQERPEQQPKRSCEIVASLPLQSKERCGQWSFIDKTRTAARGLC